MVGIRLSKLTPFTYIDIYPPFFHKTVDTRKFLRDAGWLDESGRLIPDKEHEAVRLRGEGPELYTSAYRAFNQGCNMPPHRERSIHPLQATPPKMLKAGIRLRLAQSEGVGSLCWLEELHGLAIQADDMGVGKTFQLLGLMLRSQPREAVKTNLLVVPAGAMTMWKANLNMFPDLLYIEYNTYNKDQVDVKDLVKYEVVLSTYKLIAKQHNNYAERVLDIKAAVQGKTSRSLGSGFDTPLDIHRHWAPLYGMAFHRVILDEAHRTRNVPSDQSKAMLKLDTHEHAVRESTLDQLHRRISSSARRNGP